MHEFNKIMEKVTQEVETFLANRQDKIHKLDGLELGLNFSIEKLPQGGIELHYNDDYSIKLHFSKTLATYIETSEPESEKNDLIHLPFYNDEEKKEEEQVKNPMDPTVELGSENVLDRRPLDEADIDFAPHRTSLHIRDSQFGMIKDYNLLKKIGTGGTASVFLAQHKNTLQLFVIKFISRIRFNTATLKRFFQEVRISLRLDHPNIAKTISFDKTDENVWYLVMEYVNGVSLSEYIAEQGPLDTKLALKITFYIASALEHALTLNIIHRDLKPGNILLEKDQFTVKLIDFGIGKILGESNLTNDGQIFGTLHYMSPEQLSETKDVDHRTDIYSLGGTLYQMLSGKVPYWEEDGFDVGRAICTRDPFPLKDIRPDVPEEVIAIVTKAMARDVRDRYQTPGFMLEDVKKVFKHI